MKPKDDWRVLARYADEGTEGDWQFPVGELEPGPDGIEVKRDAHPMLVLPRPYPLDMRVELVLGAASGSLMIEAFKYDATLGLGADPASRLQANGWPVAVTGRVPAPPEGDRRVVFERAHGRISVSVDGRPLLAADDPLPEEPMPDASFYLPKGTVLRHARVLGGRFEPEARAPAATPPRRGFALYHCVDFYDDLIRSAWTEKTFRSAVQTWRKLGVERLYFIYHYGADGGFWDQPGREAEFPGFQANIDRTIREVGDFLPAAVRYAREADLPVFAVLKPYESALYGTFPEGSEDAKRYGKIPRLGGPIWWSPNFVAQNPHLREARDVSSVPADLAGRLIASVVLTAEEGSGAALDPGCIRLWVSPGNGVYTPYDGVVQTRVESGTSTRIVLDGLRIPERYIALTVEGEPTFAFGNVRRNLIEVRDERGERLPVTFADRTRLRKRDWREVGFNIDIPSGNAVGAMDDYVWLDGKLPLGIALGLEKHLQGALCFACPETRAWMLGQVDRCIEAGVEGVDFRIVNHNRTFDWDVYGFNEPLVEAYRERWGVNILSEPFDREKWRRLRGEFYTGFLREAVARLRAAGKAVHLHISPRMSDPSWHTTMEVHYDWAGWLREGLADEITLKMGFTRRGAAPAVIHAAREAGVPVNLCPYLNGYPTQPDGRRILEWGLREAQLGGVDGFIMYENAAFMAGQDGGEARLTHAWIPDLIARASRGG